VPRVTPGRPPSTGCARSRPTEPETNSERSWNNAYEPIRTPCSHVAPGRESEQGVDGRTAARRAGVRGDDRAGRNRHCRGGRRADGRRGGLCRPAPDLRLDSTRLDSTRPPAPSRGPADRHDTRVDSIDAFSIQSSRRPVLSTPSDGSARPSTVGADASGQFVLASLLDVAYGLGWLAGIAALDPAFFYRAEHDVPSTADELGVSTWLGPNPDLLVGGGGAVLASIWLARYAGGSEGSDAEPSERLPTGWLAGAATFAVVPGLTETAGAYSLPGLATGAVVGALVAAVYVVVDLSTSRRVGGGLGLAVLLVVTLAPSSLLTVACSAVVGALGAGIVVRPLGRVV
jgi:hypothetical protein